jgi:hypothetical protein
MSNLYAALSKLIEWCESERAIIENTNKSLAKGQMIGRAFEDAEITDICQATIDDNKRRIAHLDEILVELTETLVEATTKH